MRNLIVNYFPTPLLILISIALMMLISYLIHKIVNLYFPNYVIKPIINGHAYYRIFTSVSTILIAFMVVVLWQNQMMSKTIVHGEASDLAKILINSKSFPQNEQQHIADAIGQYTKLVVNEEWDLMKWEKSSPKATQAMTNIRTVIAAYTPGNATEAIFYKEIISAYYAAYENRNQRLDKLDNLIPASLFSMIIVCLLILVASVSMVDEYEKNTTTVLCFFVNIIVGLSLAIIITFDFPFAGDISVNNKSFIEKVMTQLPN